MDSPRVLRLVLVDADFYASKSYSVFSRFNVEGRGVGIPFGVINTLSRIIKESSPRHLIVCWGDRRENLWRREELSSYKADREAHPPDFGPQIDDCKNLIEAMGLPQMLIPKWEADDIIARLAFGFICPHSGPGPEEVWIYSNDHDMLQLCRGNIKVIREKQKGIKEVFGPTEVEEKYGVGPYDLPLLFAWVGEKGDGIPGIKGVGPKTAARVINGEKDTPGVGFAEKMKNIQTVNRNKRLIELGVHPLPFDQNTLQISPTIDVNFIESMAGTLKFGDRWKGNASRIIAFSRAASKRPYGGNE